VISRCYNLLLHVALGVGFSDAQCGFKAIRADAARELLPLVEDTSWFFDTELLVLAERAGLRIHEVPVDWADDPDSRVDIAATALADLRGIARVGYGLATGRLKVPRTNDGPRQPQTLAWQLPRFLAIGLASTAVYVILYLALRSFLPPQAANLISLLITAIGNTAANRRLTFGIRGSADLALHQARGLTAFLTGLALTTGALLALHAGDPSAGKAAEVGVLVLANLLATMSRFVLYRGWVFAGGPRGRRPARHGAKIPPRPPRGRASGGSPLGRPDVHQDPGLRGDRTHRQHSRGTSTERALLQSTPIHTPGSFQ
jgi:putative flippase GtrA